MVLAYASIEFISFDCDVGIRRCCWQPFGALPLPSFFSSDDAGMGFSDLVPVSLLFLALLEISAKSVN